MKDRKDRNDRNDKKVKKDRKGVKRVYTCFGFPMFPIYFRPETTNFYNPQSSWSYSKNCIVGRGELEICE